MVADLRVGLGFDAHAFAEGRRLVLCGVDIPYELGLLGHSDADVALHAIADALLGACSLGDIGEHFPPGDPRWKDASSSEIVKRVLEMVAEEGWRPVQCDLVIVAETPKLSPYRGAMRLNVASLLGLGERQVGVKMTTTEGMGFVGRREGIAAMAVVLVSRVSSSNEVVP